MLIKNKVAQTRNNRINYKLLIHENLRESERGALRGKTHAELIRGVIKSLSAGIQACFLQVSNGVTWITDNCRVSPPLPVQKYVIWGWITLSLIDKGERSPEMIHAECRCKKPVSAFCYSTKQQQHLEDETTAALLLTASTGRWLDARHRDNGGTPYGPLFTII